MYLGDMILGLALVFYIIDFVALLARKLRFGLYPLTVASLLSISATVSFAWFFITDNFALKAVYEQSSKSLPPLLKLAASWSGAGGSLLLWLLFMAIALLVFRLKNSRSMNSQRIVASLVMNFFTMAVLTFAIATSPFDQLQISVPDGLGMNPSLQTLFSVVHPLIIFVAYSTLLLSYSQIIGKSWARKTRLDESDERVLWRSWLYLSLGISIGGYWAYQTLGWGGYWAWDPLETSALITWLALSALLFAKYLGHATGHDLLAITFSASSLFVTVYIARSASVASIHGYGNFIGGAAIMGLALVPVLLSFVSTSRNKTTQINTDEDAPSAILAFWSLMLIASADLIILLYQSLGPTIGLAFQFSTRLYNYASFPTLIVFLMVIFVKCIEDQPRRRDVTISLTLLFAIGFILSLLHYPTQNILASVGIPFIVGMLGATIWRILKWALWNGRRFRPLSDIKYVAFFGLGVLLLGVFVSSSMSVSTTITAVTGQSIRAFGLDLSVVQIETSTNTNQVYLPPYGMVPESIDSRISYTLSDNPSSISLLVLKYYPALNQFVPTVSIHTSFLEDRYVVAAPTDSLKEATALALKFGAVSRPADVKITVTIIPAVSLVWLGAAIMIIASVPFTLMASKRIEMLDYAAPRI